MKILELLSETLKKVNGRWALVSKNTGRVLRYYKRKGKPSDSWVSKTEKQIQYFKHLKENLITSPRAYEVAKGNKIQMIVVMSPHKFLGLTTDSKDRDIIIKNSQSVDFYNQLMDKGEILVMPFLDIDLKTCTIVGHEGRHRAAALIKMGVDEMTVGIKMRPSEKEVQKYKYTRNNSEYSLNSSDFPPVVKGQYAGTTVLKKTDFKIIKDGWDKIIGESKINEAFYYGYRFKEENARNFGKYLEIFKNPTVQEMRTLKLHERSIPGFVDASTGDFYAFTPEFLHFNVLQTRKIDFDFIPVRLFVGRGEIGVMVTDSVKHNNKWSDSPKVAQIIKNSYLSKLYKNIVVSYYNEDIVGNWEEL